MFSRSSLLLFILIFHSLAAMWLNSTRISAVILIYNAGFYILLAMINSCRVFSISFLCMSQKWVCFNQSEVHLQSFNLKLICMVSAYLKFIFKASISDVHSQIKLQSDIHLHFRASFCSSFAWFSNEKEELSVKWMIFQRIFIQEPVQRNF